MEYCTYDKDVQVGDKDDTKETDAEAGKLDLVVATNATGEVVGNFLMINDNCSTDSK